MALTKSAGRLAIRVVPDSKGFRQDLQKFLDRIEKSTRIKIKAEPVLDRAALAKMKRDIQNLAIKITPKIELNIGAEEIAELVAKIEKAKPVVDVALNTRMAAARMANLSRTRTAVIVPVLARAAVAKVAQRLAALGGGNVFADTFKEAGRFLSNIDREAVRLGTIANGVMAIAGAAGALTSNLLVLSGNISQLVGFATLLPAFGIGLGIQIGALAAIMQDFSTELAHLEPAMAELQDILSFTFWREARPAITELVEHLMPALIDTFDKLGTAQGIFTARLAQSIQKHLTLDRFTTMMDRMVDGIRAATDGIDPFIHAITLLGLHGSKYFERFGKWITHLSERFDAFITKSFNNGDLERWTENAIRTFFDLGRVISGTTRWFSALTQAARRAGGADLGDLADSLHAMADVMERPAFQTTMTRIFRGMHALMGELMIGLGDLGRGFIAMGPEIETAFKIVGSTLRTVLGYVADFMENEAFQAGFLEFFGGIARGVDNLAPGIEAAATSFGGLLDLIGLVAEELGNLLATVLVEWSPALDTIGEELETLVVPLSETFQQVVKDLTPVFDTLANEVIPPVVDLVEGQLLPALEDLAGWAAPQLEEFFSDLGNSIEKDVIPWVEKFREDLKTAGTEGDGALATFLTRLDELIGVVSDETPDWGGWFGGNGRGPGFHIDRIIEDFTRLQEKIDEVAASTGMEGNLGQSLNKWAEDAGRIYDDVANNLYDGLTEFTDEFGRRWDEFWGTTIPGSMKEYTENAKRDLSDWYGGIKGMFQDWMDELMPNWDEFWAELFGEPAVQLEGMSSAGFFGDGKLRVNEDLAAWLEDMGARWNTFWGETFPVAWDDFRNGFMEGWATFWSPEGLGGILVAFFTSVGEGWNNFWGVTLPEAWNNFTTWLGESWNTYWTGLGETLNTHWTNFWTTVTTKFEEIRMGLATKAAEIQLGWDTFWTGVGTTLSTKWEEFKTTVATKIAEIRTSISNKVTEIQTNWNTGWTNIGTTLSTKWNDMGTTVRTKAVEMGGTISRWMTDAQNNIRNGWEVARQVVSNKWDEIETAVQTGVDDAIAWVQDLPNRAREALNIDLSGSGASLIGGFISGMQSMLGEATRVASGIVQAVRNFFPGSPAKEGPFSGKGWVSYSGRAVVDSFAKGMEDRVELARAAARKVAEASQIETDAIDDNFKAGLEGGGPGDHRTNIFNTYYPVAEKQSRTIEKASGVIRMKGGL